MERLTFKDKDICEKCIDRYYNHGCKTPCYKAKLYRRLKYYEDAEEQGLLLRLPCKVGDTVYRCGDPIKMVYEYDIQSIEIYDDEIIFVDNCSNEFTEKDIGKTVFLTREEAERKLKEMKE